ncbi:hypothetical protein NBO_136g0004 [Nosema bombycis CQ1]|uniref:Uncharacterized protein n=1 Tax=Nosema bombycis (strain CQ1 / CVCC 102059) TaxID=578461 RepID=R0M594_NOSB1|nr:hypothetical protein NBO_136g0004 [Nosema bombycis CQ1]|eukprot:EOB13184.1 hypothetical protein NBO_136g0004 [Nosema bombycis CQ1]
MNMEDRQKIEYVISRGSYELIDCHCSLKKRKTAWTYSGWKEDLIKNITKGKLTRGELYRRKQGKNEKLVDYRKQ